MLTASAKIERRPDAAAARRWDIVVIGGGIYGVAVAFEAARRGLSPLLLERDDFGGAASRNWLRIVHGGLRYLQSMDLHRHRESVAERRWFLQTYPELVQPLTCLMPLYGRGLKRPSAFRAAFLLDAILARHRNEGVAADHVLAAGRVLDPAATIGFFPGVAQAGLQGGALWHDAAAPRGPRLLIELLRWACTAGASALNRADVQDIVVEGGRVVGVTATDRLSGGTLSFETSLVINTAGPWCGDIAAKAGNAAADLFRPTMAFNLLIDRAPLSEAALALEPGPKGGRLLFLLPLGERFLAGTGYTPWKRGREPLEPDAAAVRDFIADLNAAVPGLDIAERDVLQVHAGLQPAATEGGTEVSVREVIHDHAGAGGPDGLISVSGVKYTTARLVAEKALRAALRRKGESLAEPGSVPRPPVRELPDAAGFLALLGSDPDGASRLVGEIAAEESALEPDDIIWRRTDWSDDPPAAEEIREHLLSRGSDGVRRPDEYSDASSFSERS